MAYAKKGKMMAKKMSDKASKKGGKKTMVSVKVGGMGGMGYGKKSMKKKKK